MANIIKLNIDCFALGNKTKCYGRKGDKCEVLTEYTGPDGSFFCVKNLTRFNENGAFDVNSNNVTTI